MKWEQYYELRKRMGYGVDVVGSPLKRADVKETFEQVYSEGYSTGIKRGIRYGICAGVVLGCLATGLLWHLSNDSSRGLEKTAKPPMIQRIR